MSPLLRSKSRYYEWDAHKWEEILNVARNYGWVPMGTRKLDLFDREGNHMNAGHHIADSGWDLEFYVWRGYRIVTEEDSANLAFALERALADIPDNPFTRFCSHVKADLERAIRMCREGSFIRA